MESGLTFNQSIASSSLVVPEKIAQCEMRIVSDML